MKEERYKILEVVNMHLSLLFQLHNFDSNDENKLEEGK